MTEAVVFKKKPGWVWFLEAITKPLNDQVMFKSESSTKGGNAKEQLRTAEEPGDTETSAEEPEFWEDKHFNFYTLNVTLLCFFNNYH